MVMDTPGPAADDACRTAARERQAYVMERTAHLYVPTPDELVAREARRKADEAIARLMPATAPTPRIAVEKRAPGYARNAASAEPPAWADDLAEQVALLVDESIEAALSPIHAELLNLRLRAVEAERRLAELERCQ
jgi:hypothetical protein